MLDELSQWASSMSAEVEISSDIPCWLDTLLREEFFGPCLSHPGVKQNEKNIFCLDCCMGLCCNCSSTHIGHRVLQIRKYNDHRVVKTEDMEKLLDCSSVQSYMLNRAQVVFLKARSPNKKKEKAQNQAVSNKKRARAQKQEDQTSEKNCSSCPRSLKNEFDYCSITCMVKELLRTVGSISGQLRECKFLSLPLFLEEAEEELVSGEPVLRGPTTSSSIVNVATSKKKKKNKEKEEASPCAPVSLHRRKGIPRRSPLY